MMYRAGSMVKLDSGTYDWRIVSAEQFEAAKAEGWHLDQYAAAVPAVPAEVPAEVAPMGRAALEAAARSKGLKFDGRTSDKRLAEMLK